MEIFDNALREKWDSLKVTENPPSPSDSIDDLATQAILRTSRLNGSAQFLKHNWKLGKLWGWKREMFKDIAVIIALINAIDDKFHREVKEGRE